MSDMAVTDRYSRLVLWLKVALPLAALAILSTLFFAAETLDPEAAIPYAEVDVDRILSEQGVSGPTFGGVTETGVAIAMMADSVRPGETDTQLQATNLVAGLDFPNGGRVDVESTSGSVDSSNQVMTLFGGARLESSTGYVVETERLVASIRDGNVTAPDTVRATGPVGDLTAGSMEVSRSKTDNTHLLVFKDGVRLIYQPKN